MEYTTWDKGKPISTSNEKEAIRLSGRVAIIDKILKEMGYKEGYGKYQECINDMMKDFSGKYMPFLKRVDELAKENNV